MVIAMKDHNTIFKFQNPIAEGDTCKRKLDTNKSHNSSIDMDYANTIIHKQKRICFATLATNK